MKINLWMIANRLNELDIEVNIRKSAGLKLRSARLAYATNCAYVYQDGADVICADEADYIRIRNIEKNVAFEMIQGVFDYYDYWSEELEMAIYNEDKNILIEVLWKVFDKPIVLFDANQNVAAMTRQYECGEVDEEWDYLLNYGCSSFDGMKKIRGMENSLLRQGGGPRIVSIQKDNRLTTYLSSAIMYKDIRYGQIVILEKGREINCGDVELLKYVVRHMEKNIKETTFKSPMGLKSAEFIDLILGRPVNLENMNHQLMRFDWKRDDPYRVLLLFAEQGGPDRENQLQIMYYSVRSVFRHTGCFTYDNMVVLILNDRIQEKTWLKGNMDMILKQNHGTVSEGYSISGIENIRFSYQQALFAFRNGNCGNSESDGYSYFSCAMDDLVQSMWAEKTEIPSLLYSCHPDVLMLWKLDLETEGNYIETLTAFLENERSLVGTANALHIHRSTLIYRTKKLEKLMASSLDDAYNREYIILSVRILKYFEREIPDLGAVCI
ncbi:MAG: PucR family transcriptional regulator [Lachnospiraceae bacterium]